MKKIAIALFSGLLLSPSLYAENVLLDDFEDGLSSSWKKKEFKGETNYQVEKQQLSSVLKAHSSQSASGLFVEKKIDLSKTPYLNWQWKIDSRLTVDNEKIKGGDDYAARIYVIKDGGFFFWKTKALNYVWSNHLAIETIWDNAFAPDNAKMLAVRSVDDQTGTWYTEKRHIANDFKNTFGIDLQEIDAVAIMTDTDNHGDEAVSFYDNIYFSAE